MSIHDFVRFALAGAFFTTMAVPAWSQSREAPDAEGYDVRAAAQEGESYGVVFDDDPMFALGPDTLIPRLTVRKSVPMAGLLRPRTSFVPELLKSAETF